MYVTGRKHTACVDFPMKPERVAFIIKSKVEFKNVKRVRKRIVFIL